MRELIFWGARGQAVVLRGCLAADERLVALFDTAPDVRSPFEDVPLLGGWEAFTGWAAARTTLPACLVAIGGAGRREVQERLEAAGLQPAIARHPTAFVAASATLGPGTQILAMAAVCERARLGRACIVNTGASVDHECHLADGVHVGPGARLAGLVTVGRDAFIGMGALILPRLTIGAGALVGAGTVVTRDVPPNAVVAGNPARHVRDLS